MAQGSNLVLVDTSVWVDFLTGAESAQRHELHRLIDGGKPVILTGLIVMEILQGIRRDKHFDAVRTQLSLYPIVEPSMATYFQAASLYRKCRKQGITVRSPIDCLISVIAVESGATLLHKDRDFTAISRVFPLKLHSFAQTKN
ncbi:MAG: type II toxin-antitoxin system VapC family toxin [Acidobacteriota bacterium]